MFKVVSVVDKTDTAIDRLAKGMIPYLSSIEYHVVDVHPKRPEVSQLQQFEELAKTADVIDYQYFRTAEMLRERYDWLKGIPSVLTHHNPYSITERNWNDYDVVVANNKTIKEQLSQITSSRLELISNAVDPYFWRFNNEYTYDRSVIMVANRIEGKKGVLPVALACKQIGAKLRLVGSISDMDYWRQVIATGAVEFAQAITDEELRKLYYKSGIHVCNSVDNFESGTNPILEAIFCGVPVLTRMIGHVPEFYKDDNLMIHDGQPDDVEAIANKLEELFADKKRLERMRHDAWGAIKDRNFERRAYKYLRLYRELKRDKPVTVIMPVAGRADITAKSIDAVLCQTYQNLELIVVDDGEVDQEATIRQLQTMAGIPFRYIRVEQPGYNLAKARNVAAIEATSDILVFCDQRMIMDKNAVRVFVDNLKDHHWLYGSKGAKKDFVENFSCISRSDFFTLGMFNERCTSYGAMSQECRSRARRQGFNTLYIEEATATPEGKSRNRYTKKIEIMESKNWLWKAGLQ